MQSFPSLPAGWHLTALPDKPFRTVAVDPGLTTLGRAVCAVHLPLTPAAPTQQLPPVTRLMLGAAAVLTADLSPEPEVLLDFARLLRFHPDNFRKSRPVLSETAVQGVPGRIVRDGHTRRAYFCGSAHTLACACPMLWDAQPRAMTAEDLAAIPQESVLIGLATAEVLPDGLHDLTYLGSLAVSDAPNAALMKALRQLKDEGYEVLLAAPGEVLPPDALLIASAPGSAPTLIPPDTEASGLVEAVQTVSLQARHALDRQRKVRLRTLLGTASCLAVLMLCGGFLAMAGVSALPFALGLMLLTAAALILPGQWLRFGRALTLGLAGALLAAGALCLTNVLSPLTAGFALLSGSLAAVCFQAFRRN